MAFEDGKLEVIAVVATRFEHAPEAFAVGDVVGDDIRGSHGEGKCAGGRLIGS